VHGFKKLKRWDVLKVTLSLQFPLHRYLLLLYYYNATTPTISHLCASYQPQNSVYPQCCMGSNFRPLVADKQTEACEYGMLAPTETCEYGML
jgi:hypothetical protein